MRYPSPASRTCWRFSVHASACGPSRWQPATRHTGTSRQTPPTQSWLCSSLFSDVMSRLRQTHTRWRNYSEPAATGPRRSQRPGWRASCGPSAWCRAKSLPLNYLGWCGCVVLGMGEQRVVPLSMELVASDLMLLQGFHLFVGDLDAFGVGVGV